MAASARTLFDTLSFANDFLNTAVGLLVTLAILVFFWGLIRYIASVGEKKAEGMSIMFYGIIAIFVMVSIWGIIKVLQNTFGVGGANRPPPPTAPTDMIDRL